MAAAVVESTTTTHRPCRTKNECARLRRFSANNANWRRLRRPRSESFAKLSDAKRMKCYCNTNSATFNSNSSSSNNNNGGHNRATCRSLLLIIPRQLLLLPPVSDSTVSSWRRRRRKNRTSSPMSQPQPKGSPFSRNQRRPINTSSTTNSDRVGRKLMQVFIPFFTRFFFHVIFNF